MLANVSASKETEFEVFVNGALTELLNITLGYKSFTPAVGAATSQFEIGIVIQRCTFGEFFSELVKLFPTAIPDDMSLAQIGASLGAEIDRHRELHGNHTDVAKLGMFDVGEWIRGKLADLTLPKTTITFIMGNGEWAMSIKVEACVLWGMPLEIGLFIQKGGGGGASLGRAKKRKSGKGNGWAVYLGFKMEKNKRSSNKDSSQKATDTIKQILGDPIRRLGFVIASKNIKDVRQYSSLKFEGTKFQDRLPFVVDDIWPGPQIYTESDLTTPGSGDSFVGKMGQMMETIAGDSDPSENTLGGTVAKKNTPAKKKRAVFCIPLSMSPTICLGMDFRPEDGGIPLSDTVMFTSVVLEGCVTLLPFELSLSIEASADIKVQKDLDIPIEQEWIIIQAGGVFTLVTPTHTGAPITSLVNAHSHTQTRFVVADRSQTIV